MPATHHWQNHDTSYKWETYNYGHIASRQRVYACLSDYMPSLQPQKYKFLRVVLPLFEQIKLFTLTYTLATDFERKVKYKSSHTNTALYWIEGRKPPFGFKRNMKNISRGKHSTVSNNNNWRSVTIHIPPICTLALSPRLTEEKNHTDNQWFRQKEL